MYNEIKQSFGVENYVKFNLDKCKRSQICLLRCGILRLELETARYTNTPWANRLCKICDSSEVETEYHFLFHCKSLDQERLNSYYMYPELLNFSEDACKLIQLSLKPYLLGKLVDKLWHKQISLYQNEL